MALLEICVDSVESAIAAERGGAQRLELCSDLLEGGVTPSAGLIDEVHEHVSIPVFLMIRPRGGDFCYTAHEFRLMKKDIEYAVRAGAGGLVLGVLDSDSRVDIARTRELVELARPLPVTFHRALDMAAAPVEAVESIIATGARRALTSGGRSRALDGIEVIREMIAIADGRITVMVGGGLNSKNIRKVAKATGATEFHASLSRRVPSPVRRPDESMFLGTNSEREYSRFIVREVDVRGLSGQLSQFEGPHLDEDAEGSSVVRRN